MPVLGMFPVNLVIPPLRNLSSIGSSTDTITQLSIQPLISIHPSDPRFTTIIRMGGGPRTFPGGVSKWQWKRMQAKKQKQLLKARLCRERQIYEMRKRAELKAAVSELERPWEVVERAPTLFSLSADEQVKTLADRFQKPGGYDMWSERDGPQLFHTPEGLPSARFLPKGAVHSVKPYGVRGNEDSVEQNEGEMYNGHRKRPRRKNFDSQASTAIDNERNSRQSSQDLVGGLKNLRISSRREESSGEGYGKPFSRGSLRTDESKGNVKLGNLYGSRGSLRSKEPNRNGNAGSSHGGQWNKKQLSHDMENSPRMSTGQHRDITGSDFQRTASGRGGGRSRGRGKVNVPQTREYDMCLKHDGSYELQSSPQKGMFSSDAFDDDFELDLTYWRTN